MFNLLLPVSGLILVLQRSDGSAEKTFRHFTKDVFTFLSNLCGGGGGGDRGVTISLFPYPVLPPPVRFCPFVSQLPPFIVFLPLSRKSRCLTPYSDSNRECFGLVQNKKLCCKSNHSALFSAIIEAAFLRHKFTPRGKIFITKSLHASRGLSRRGKNERNEREASAGFRSVD